MPVVPAGGAPRKRLTLLPLCAATYFMVSGGPYGLEELVGRAGYKGALLAIALTPLLWSLPTALMVGELSAALPEPGGYYAWVRRALGPFWGFQEAWLSLMASVFDMAIYPTLFVHYVSRLWPGVQPTQGLGAFLCGAAMIALCTAWNLSGSRAVGWGALGLSVVLLAPFFVFGAVSLGAHATPVEGPALGQAGLLGALTIAMWNFMGWDNASTVAGEVERPQRTYPLALLLTLVAVAATYALPVWASWRAGIDPTGWDTGSWVDAARSLAGAPLAWAMSAGGVICAVGMFTALMLSYSRVPAALAEEGLLPRALNRRDPQTGTPTVAVLVCALAYTACLGLGFDRLVELDVALYGASLLLEFVALVVLRVREPSLPRPFRVPGGLVGACLVGVPPMVMVVLALVGVNQADQGGGLWPWSLLLAALGPVVWLLVRRRPKR